MDRTFEHVVRDILANIDGSKQKKAALKEDLLFELNELEQSYIEQGFTHDEAHAMAAESIGDSSHVSEQLQQKVNPFQRKTMYALALSSLLFTFLLYLAALIIERQALITWLLTSVAINVILLLFVARVLKADKKWLINTVLIGHIIITYVGLTLALSLDSFLVTMYVIYAILLMLIATALIYLNIFFHWDMSNREKWFHIYNTTTGIIIITLNGFFFIMYSIFSDRLFGEGLLVLIPFIIWLVIYSVQIQLLKKNMTKLAIGLAIIPLLIIGGFALFYIYL